MSQFVSNLKGKTISIVGGSGYTGTAISEKAVGLGCNVISISRSGQPHYNSKQLKEHKNIQWVKANALHEADSLLPYFQQSHLVIHTIGTLLPGKGDTSYDSMNRQTAVNVANVLQQVASDQHTTLPLVYLSASGAPPLLPQYLSTKQAAEQFILAQPNLKGVILKPGFIACSTNKPFSVALQPLLSLYNSISTPLLTLTNNTPLNCLTRHLYIDRAVQLNHVAYAAIVAGLDKSITSHSLYNQDIEQVVQKFVQNNYNVELL